MLRLTATDVRCLQTSSKVKFYKNQATVDLVPKGGKLPMCGDIYICLYDADLGSKDVSRAPPSATHKPLSSCFRRAASQDKMCSLWFNTSFVATGQSWLMEKPIIDKANKNKTQFQPEFKLELFFE